MLSEFVYLLKGDDSLLPQLHFQSLLSFLYNPLKSFRNKNKSSTSFKLHLCRRIKSKGNLCFNCGTKKSNHWWNSIYFWCILNFNNQAQITFIFNVSNNYRNCMVHDCCGLLRMHTSAHCFQLSSYKKTHFVRARAPTTDDDYH